MKSFVWLATLSMLVLAVFCGASAPLHQAAQAAVLTEGSFPAPEMHRDAPEQLTVARGEGSYPTPCGPRDPRCKSAEKPTLQAGEGSYPTPCGPRDPRCKGASNSIALLGDGAAPAPFEMPGGMN